MHLQTNNSYKSTVTGKEYPYQPQDAMSKRRALEQLQADDGDVPVLTSSQFLAKLASEKRGRQQSERNAEAREAERKANAPATEVNAPRKVLENLARHEQAGGVAMFSSRTVKLLKDQAALRDKEIQAEQAEQERRASIDADPAVIVARQNAGFLLQAATQTGVPEFVDLANEAVAIANEADCKTYWTACRDLEQAIWQFEDSRAQEAMAKRHTTSTEFTEAAQRATEAATRLEIANAQQQ